MSDERGKFDPSKHLSAARKNGPQDYLAVKWRLVWLRDTHPDAVIDTEKMSGGTEARYAEFRARVTLPTGGSATGYGSETAQDFGDFIEKAETKAIGRALAALGFGTQFVGDELDEGTRIVDSPVERSYSLQRNGTAPTRTPTPPAAQSAPQLPAEQQRATERQVKFTYAIGRESGLTDEEITQWSQELYGMDVEQLNRRDCSAMIEALQRRRNEVA